MRKSLIIIAILATGGLMAQQDAMYTHYMFNTLSVNPAYAGSRNALTITGLHRSQWVGFDGAPTTQTLTAHSPLNERLALGLSVVNDKVGPVRSTSAFADFAYRLPVNDKARLVFGIKGGFNVLQGDILELVTEQDGDNTLQNVSGDLQPNLGAGIYYDAERFYVGISAPGFLENDFGSDDGQLLTQFDQQRHYFLIAGTMLELNERWDLKPTTLIKVTEAAPIEADLTATFLLDQKFWLGAMYRTGDAAGILAGIQINDQLAAGYSFDFSFVNETITYNGGSHELMLRYDFFFKEEEKVRSPRYF